MIDKELKDEKAVKIAINRIHKGEYKIVEQVPEVEETAEEATEEVAEAEAEENV